MSAETDVKDTLDAAASLIALVSTRIYPDVRPDEDILPAVIFGRVGTDYTRTIHGTVILTKATMAIACFASTRTSAELVADAAYTALLAAGFNPVDRQSDYEEETDTHQVTVFFEHIQT